MKSSTESREDQLQQDLAVAVSLLHECQDGFSAFIQGRKLARPDRDKLRARIDDFLLHQRLPAAKRSG